MPQEQKLYQVNLILKDGEQEVGDFTYKVVAADEAEASSKTVEWAQENDPEHEGTFEVKSVTYSEQVLV